jgi:hypothetical protein
VPQHPNHFFPGGRGDVLDIVVHKNILLSEVRVLDIMDSNDLLLIFDDAVARQLLVPVKKFTLGAVSKPPLCLSISENRN